MAGVIGLLIGAGTAIRGGTAVNDTSVVIATGYVYGHAAGTAATYLIVMVLGAVGLSVDLRAMTRLGIRPNTVGLLLAGVMGVLSLGLIRLLAIA